MALKTLAPFVIVCVGLLAFVVWQSRPVSHDAASDTRSAPVEVSRQPTPTPVTFPTGGAGRNVESEARVTTARPGPAYLPEQATSSPLVATTQNAVGLTRATSVPATQPSTPGIAGAGQLRAEQQFIELGELLVSDPYNQAALEAALELARELHRYDEVCDLLVRLVRLRPADAALRFALATQLMRLERWIEAIPHLRSVVEQEPDNARAWYNLAIAHQALAHLRDARVTWDRVIELMPQNPDAYAHRGEVLLDLRHWREAAADFRTVLRIEPDSIDAALNSSLALSKLGRFADARAKLLPVLDTHPRHVPVLNRLARIAWAAYQADQASRASLPGETVRYCRRSLAIDADQPEISALLERASEADE